MKTVLRTIALSLTFVAPALSQPGPGPRRGPMSIDAIIDARRALKLTPRQLTQLDSIERSHYAQRESMRARFMAKRDSMCGKQEECRLSEGQAAALRDWRRSQFSEVDMLRRDSLSRARVMSILDSTQRRMLTERPRGRMASARSMERRSAEGRAMMRRYDRMGPRFRPEMAPGFRSPRGRVEMGPDRMGMRRGPMGPGRGFDDRRGRIREFPPEIEDRPRRVPPRGRRPGDDEMPDTLTEMVRLP